MKALVLAAQLALALHGHVHPIHEDYRPAPRKPVAGVAL